MGEKHEKTPRTAKDLLALAGEIETCAARFREAAQLMVTADVASAMIRNKSNSEAAVRALSISADKAIADVEEEIKNGSLAAARKRASERAKEAVAAVHEADRKVKKKG
jgi:hypothetical protein